MNFLVEAMAISTTQCILRTLPMAKMYRLDKFSTTVNLTKVEEERAVTRSMTVYSFMGFLEICRYSNQPRANAVMDFLFFAHDDDTEPQAESERVVCAC
jgi:hypothetical protein